MKFNEKNWLQAAKAGLKMDTIIIQQHSNPREEKTPPALTLWSAFYELKIHRRILPQGISVDK